MGKLLLLSSTLVAVSASAALYTGNLVANPYFGTNSNDYTEWTINSNWRANGNNRNLVYDFKLPGTGSGYAGFRSAVASTIDLTLDPAITGDPSHDPALTELTNLNFGDLYLTYPTWNFNKIGDLLDANFYAQVNITTTSNSYRMQSTSVNLSRDNIVDNGILTTGEQPFSTSFWATYGSFDGNPFDGGNGIPLNDIINIEYKWLINTFTENAFSTNHPNYTTNGTFFFQADNAHLQYEVRTPSNNVYLANVFSDNMVLQRDAPIPVSGTTDPFTTITVTMSSGEATNTTADAGGNWTAVLPAMSAGGPVTMTVYSGGIEQIVVSNILIGDIWLCSGQSNMEWNLSATSNSAAEIAAATNLPNLRLVETPNEYAATPQADLGTRADWQVTSPATVGNFSSVAYYFGKKLTKEEGIPIGLIDSNWGGTRIEPWAPVPLPNGTVGTDQQEPTVLYNKMIHPYTQLPIKGAIWYQGEANIDDGSLYAPKLQTLVDEWRAAWAQGNFPFYLVQLAPFDYGGDAVYNLPLMWAAQTKASELIPNSGMAVINDIGDIGDIHPRNKAPVGERLALLAQHGTYGHSNLVHSGPFVDSVTQEGSQLRISFNHVGGGLVSRDANPLNWFEIAADDYVYTNATATIDGDTVLVSAASITNPETVRFAWHETAEPNLMNAEGLPANSFQKSYKLVQNGGFEGPQGNGRMDATGHWVQNGEDQAIAQAGWAAETGLQGAWLQGWTANITNSFHQDVPVVAGNEYILDAAIDFAPNFESNGGQLDMALIWLDAASAELSRETIDADAQIDTSWKHLAITNIAPSGTENARIWFGWSTDDMIENSSSSAAFIDNVSLTLHNSAYDLWAKDYGLTGGNASATYDMEPDGLDNLMEYGLGGNPTNDDAATILPAFSTMQEGGTNWFYHIHNERTDDASLSFAVQLRSNLVSGATWQTHGLEFIGQSPVTNSFKTVTNRTDIGTQEFIRLKVTKNPTN
jgi:sialate O-acetylesterase